MYPASIFTCPSTRQCAGPSTSGLVELSSEQTPMKSVVSAPATTMALEVFTSPTEPAGKTANTSGMMMFEAEAPVLPVAPVAPDAPPGAYLYHRPGPPCAGAMMSGLDGDATDSFRSM